MPTTAELTTLYEAMVNDYSDDLYRYAYRQCGNPHTAEDLVEETFLEAWKSIAKLREPSKGRAWLFQILRFRFSHYLRDRGRRLQPKASIEQVEHLLSTPAPKLLENLSRRELLQQAFDRLEPRYRDPFLIVFLEGLSCKEAAATLDIPLGTVLSRIHRARIFLREELRDLAVEFAPREHNPPAQKTKAKAKKPSSRLDSFQQS